MNVFIDEINFTRSLISTIFCPLLSHMDVLAVTLCISCRFADNSAAYEVILAGLVANPELHAMEELVDTTGVSFATLTFS